jgi:hypothetical protein
MICKDCPMNHVVENESTYPAEESCWYGDKYFEEHSEYFTKYDEWGCRKHKKTIERDFCPPELRDWIKHDMEYEKLMIEVLGVKVHV